MTQVHFKPESQLNSTDYFRRKAELVDQWLERLLPPENARPSTIHEAMRYSIFAGGKRLRPILTIAAGEIFGAPERELLPAACSLEMIHTYSLIHDDLPAMDDDDLRRGRPTNHVVYGEAIAILAGDALLTQAFRTLADYHSTGPENKVRVISEVSQASGTIRALIGGQVLDIQSEREIVDGEQLEEIHRAKTGALIRCAVRIGAIIGGAGEKNQRRAGKDGRQRCRSSKGDLHGPLWHRGREEDGRSIMSRSRYCCSAG
jgi:geranylgeranyl diphosphate synthase type II